LAIHKKKSASVVRDLGRRGNSVENSTVRQRLRRFRPKHPLNVLYGGRIGPNLPVDITLVFLIGLAAVLVDVLFVVILYVCIKVGRRMAKQRPVKFEEWAGRFANKMTDEMSSILTHCSATTLVLMAGAWPELRGTQNHLLCATMAAFTFVFGAICYRESRFTQDASKLCAMMPRPSPKNG